MKSAFKIVGIYCLFASLWIILSDRFILLITNNPELLTQFGSLKGLFFVATTSGLLFWLVSKEIRIKNMMIDELDKDLLIRKELIRELHHRIKNNLQFVISLLNMETGKGRIPEESNEKLTSRLLSMSSVFNVVYNIQDMKNISFKDVLKEYCKKTGKPVDIDFLVKDFYQPVEYQVTLLLAIDMCIYSILSRPLVKKVSLEITNNKLIRLSADQEFFSEKPEQEEIHFARLLIESISGNLIFSQENKKELLLVL